MRIPVRPKHPAWLLLAGLAIVASGCDLDPGPALSGVALPRLGPGAYVATDAEAPAPSALDEVRGTDATIEFATWNIHNFPSHPGTTGPALASLVRDLAWDVIAFEEVSDTGAFQALLDELPGYAAVVSQATYWNGKYQKPALIYRQDSVEVLAARDLFEHDSDAFPRPALRVDVRVRRPDAAGAGPASTDLTILVVHLKAGVDTEARARRRDAAGKLHAWLAAQRAEAPDRDVLILGDYNAPLAFTESADLWPMLGDGTFLTEPLADAGAFSYIPYPRLIDHLFVADAAPADWTSAFARVAPVDASLADYVDIVSDHLPVVAFLP